MFACPVWKRLHQRFVVFSHAMTGHEMRPLLAHERNLQGAELFRKHGSSNGRSFKKHWEGFSGTPAKNAKSIQHPSKSYSTCSMEGIARNIVNHSSTQTHTHTHAVFVLLQEFRKTTDLTLRKFTWNLSQTPHVPPVRGGHRQGAWFFELQGFRMISFDCSTDFDTPQTKNGLDVGL